MSLESQRLSRGQEALDLLDAEPHQTADAHGAQRAGRRQPANGSGRNAHQLRRLHDGEKRIASATDDGARIGVERIAAERACCRTRARVGCGWLSVRAASSAHEGMEAAEASRSQVSGAEASAGRSWERRPWTAGRGSGDFWEQFLGRQIMAARMSPDANGHDPETSSKKREVSGIAAMRHWLFLDRSARPRSPKRPPAPCSPPPPCRSCARLQPSPAPALR